MRLNRHGGILALALLLASVAAVQSTAASARQSMSFSLGHHGRSHVTTTGHRGHRAGHSRGHGRSGVARSQGEARQARAANDRDGLDEGPAAKAVPGKGFSMENGVLTYPAPARFQPKNLRTR